MLYPKENQTKQFYWFIYLNSIKLSPVGAGLAQAEEWGYSDV
jgi:hypothetical protein